MEFLHTIRFLAGWLAMLCCVVPLPSFSLQQAKRRRTTNKPHDRFVDWASSNRDRGNDSTFLWIDGNNVRGIGKFEWNAVELQHRVVRLCHKYKVPNAIVVWDHGSHQLACSKRYWFDESGAEISCTSSVANSSDDDDDMFCVNLVTLFSGIRQRADDVLVKESRHLVASSFPTDGNNTAVKLDWSSLAFVTNDSELNYKLRKQATPNSPSIRLSRRKRRDIGKVHDTANDHTDALDEGAIGSNNNNNSRKRDSSPLFCDSTGFVDLLREMFPGDAATMNASDKDASDLIDAAKGSLVRCSKAQRRGYNPRREKTWERCVQAETFRRLLATTAGDEASPPLDANAVVVAEYLNELQTTRGYFGPQLRDENGIDGDPFVPFLGPSRLDKHQRRLLDRYNALAKKGELP